MGFQASAAARDRVWHLLLDVLRLLLSTPYPVEPHEFDLLVESQIAPRLTKDR
jgi:hypothetical protein